MGAFRGIPIRVHFTLLLILPLLAVMFGGAFRRAAEVAEVPPERLLGSPAVWGLGVAVGLFASVFVHELAHTLYALARGGRVRSITLMMVGGVSELTEAPPRPRDEALMALVGPLTSILLAAGFGVATWLQWDGYEDGTVTTGGLVFGLLGLVALTAGGWLGGTIVFVHGMRVEAERRTAEDERSRQEHGAA